MYTKVIAPLTVGSADLCGRCEFRPEMDSTLCRLFRCSLLDPHGTPVRCKPCRRGEEALPKWIPVSSGVYPECKRLNGYWETVPVIIAHYYNVGGPVKDEPGPLEVVGAFYEKVDWSSDPTEKTLHRFRTDEGIEYDNVEYWMPVPKPPDIKENV